MSPTRNFATAPSGSKPCSTGLLEQARHEPQPGAEPGGGRLSRLVPSSSRRFARASLDGGSLRMGTLPRHVRVALGVAVWPAAQALGGWQRTHAKLRARRSRPTTAGVVRVPLNAGHGACAGLGGGLRDAAVEMEVLGQRADGRAGADVASSAEQRCRARATNSTGRVHRSPDLRGTWPTRSRRRAYAQLIATCAGRRLVGWLRLWCGASA